MDSNDNSTGSGSSGSGTGSTPAAPLTPGTTTTTTTTGTGSAGTSSESTPAEQRQRPADVATTAGGASTVSGGDKIDAPVDTGAANDPNSSHPADGDGVAVEGSYAEKMTGRAQD